MSVNEWKQSFSEAMKNLPKDGEIIRTLDGGLCKVTIDLVEGKEPFMYGLIYVPTLVGAPAGWFARQVDDKSTYGWKAILLPKARNEIIKIHGLNNLTVGVSGFKVIRKSREGRSMLVELYHEKVTVPKVVPLVEKPQEVFAPEQVIVPEETITGV